MNGSPSVFGELPQRWQGETLGGILSRPPQEPKALVKRFFYEQSGSLLSAHPHSLKSLAGLQMMIEAPMRSTVFQHFEVSKVKRTLYIETEDPPVLVHNRVHQLCKGMGITPMEAKECGFDLRLPGAFDLVKDASILLRVIKESKPDIMVLSTEQGLLGGRDYSQQSEMFDVNATCVSIARDYCPLLLLTHSTQDPRQKRAAGTVTRAANYPVLIHFEKKVKNSDTAVHVTLDSKFDASADFSLRLIVGRQSLRIVYDEGQSPKRKDLEQYLTENPELSAKSVAVAMECDESYVRRIKREMEKRSVQ
jgi:RecA-family ATPase